VNLEVVLCSLYDFSNCGGDTREEKGKREEKKKKKKDKQLVLLESKRKVIKEKIK
jgi:hypothetical protein